MNNVSARLALSLLTFSTLAACSAHIDGGTPPNLSVPPSPETFKDGAPTPQPAPGATATPTPTPAPGGLVTVGTHVVTIGAAIVLVGQVNGQVQTENYSIQSFDDQEQTWSVYTLIQGPTPESDSSDYRSLWSSSSTQQTFTSCVSKGGSMQTITVPAGTFQTCLLSDSTARVVR